VPGGYSSSASGLKRSLDPQEKAAQNMAQARSQQIASSTKNKEHPNEETEPDNHEGDDEPADKGDETFACNVCGEPFPTRNRLFTHIQKSNHALAVSTDSRSSRGGDDDEDEDDKKRKKGKKGKKK